MLDFVYCGVHLSFPKSGRLTELRFDGKTRRLSVLLSHS